MNTKGHGSRSISIEFLYFEFHSFPNYTKFDRVIENCKLLVRRCNVRSKENTNCALTQENSDRIEKICRILRNTVRRLFSRPRCSQPLAIARLHDDKRDDLPLGNSFQTGSRRCSGPRIFRRVSTSFPNYRFGSGSGVQTAERS